MCDELIASGVPFKILGRNPAPTLAPISLYCFYDLTSPPSTDLRYFLEDVDTLINLAALLPGSNNSHIDFFSCNSVAPKLLFDLCSDVGVSKFIHVSSANILECSDGTVNCNSPYSHVLRQPSYTSSKVAGELLLMNTTSSTELFIVRPSSVYGFNIRSGFFRYVYNSLSESKVVKLKDNGLWSADFIYAGDVSKCLLSMLETITPKVFNLGSGCLTTVHSIAQSFAALLGVSEDMILLEPLIKDISSIGSLPSVPSDQVPLLLGRPPLSIAEGLDHSISTYGSF